MNKGFFYIEEKKVKKKRKRSSEVKKKTDYCEKCGLFKDCITPRMKYTGKGKKEILIIGEAPGKNEDEKGTQFIGEAGKTLRKAFKKFNIDIEEDCWKTNTIKCRPKNNKTPSIAQVNYCREKLKKEIEELKPKKIFTFGKISLQGLIGDKISVTSIKEWVGWQIPDQDYKCFIFPNYHPQHLNYNKNDVVLHNRFYRYLEEAINYNKKFKEIIPKINIYEEENTINNLRNLDALKEEIITIDIETTGLKPHRKGQEIYTISITQNNMFTFSFLLTEKIKSYLIKILQNKNIKKIAHNLQFENRWFEYHLSEVSNWYFDTQLSTHILDNRKDITGLKFQTYVNFGLVGYEKEIKKYIESIKKGGNEFNRIKECELEKILKYNGYDTYFTMLLYKKHEKLLMDHLRKGFDLFLQGNIELSRLSGIRFDKEKYDEYYKNLTEKINELHDKIMNSKEVKRLENKEIFNDNSEKQLRELLFDICKWKSNSKTNTGLKSVNEESLRSFDRKFSNNILEKRKLVKIRDTYLEQFRREAIKIKDEYFIFPFFDLNIPKTYRSSSYMVNFQNIPVRNDLAKKITRSCIIPRKDRQLLELDFKGIEVGVSCCYHYDPVMISDVTNPENDMHRDVCLDLFLRTKDTFTEKERYLAKNGFVFPSFYGSTSRIHKDEDKELGTGEITRNIWERMKENTREHLAKNGISNIYYFQEHIEKIENKFWNETFKVYQQWKWDNWRFYKKNGYIELKTGFRCSGLMSFNDVNNYPIQGSAFHILLWTLIQVSKYLRENKMKSVIIGQIHDSLVIDLEPKELNHLIKVVKKLIIEVRKYWKWINVPLTIEAEITKLNESWDTKEKIII